MKRAARAWLALGVLAFAGSAGAQGRPQQGAEFLLVVNRVQVDYGRAGRGSIPVNIEVQNRWPKAVYAFRASLKARYGPGTTASTFDLIDLLPKYVTAGREAPDNPEHAALLRSGETYAFAMNLTLARDGSPPIDVDATVDAVIFEDRTALGDAQAIQNLAHSRALRAQITEGLVEDLTFVVQAPDPMEAMQARLVALLTAQSAAPMPGKPSGKPPKGAPPQGNALSTLATIKDAKGHVVAAKDGASERIQKLEAIVKSAGGDKTKIGAIIAEQQDFVKALELHSTLQ
jgi:hypothetical protein